jgi:hypothetical protein
MTFPRDIGTAVQNVSKVTLKGGLAGKICQVLMVISLAAAAIAWSVKLLLVALLALAMIFILSLIVLWRLISLADRNPHSALMEGAEYLIHEQLMTQAKDQPQFLVPRSEIVSPGPLDLSPIERQRLHRPESAAPDEGVH